MLDALSPARRRLVVAASALAALAALTGAGAVLLARDPTPEPVAQDELGPVLLVPGYGGSTTALEVLAEALENAGRDATVVELAGDGTGDLEVQAGVLDDAVRRALDHTGAASVDVVGYSAGGVTARLWVDRLGGGAVARRVLTISSPHHGSDLAALASDLAPERCPEACLQLATDSDLLRSLNAGDETPSGPVWISIWTEGDRTVVPANSSSLDGALDFSVQSICPGATISHGDMPRDPTVIAMVTEALGRKLPAIPGPGMCG